MQSCLLIPTHPQFGKELPAFGVSGKFLSVIQKGISHVHGYSGAPVTRRDTKRSPMKIFSHDYHGKRYCSWARTHDKGDEEEVHDGGHIPAKRFIAA